LRSWGLNKNKSCSAALTVRSVGGLKKNLSKKKPRSEFITKLKQRTGEANPMFNKEKSPEFIAHMNKDRSGVNNPMYGKAKSLRRETLAKLSKMVWVYDVEKNSKLLGVFPTVMCTLFEEGTFHIGYETLKDCSSFARKNT